MPREIWHRGVRHWFSETARQAETNLFFTVVWNTKEQRTWAMSVIGPPSLKKDWSFHSKNWSVLSNIRTVNYEGTCDIEAGEFRGLVIVPNRPWSNNLKGLGTFHWSLLAGIAHEGPSWFPWISRNGSIHDRFPFQCSARPGVKVAKTLSTGGHDTVMLLMLAAKGEWVVERVMAEKGAFAAAAAGCSAFCEGSGLSRTLERLCVLCIVIGKDFRKCLQSRT